MTTDANNTAETLPSTPDTSTTTPEPPLDDAMLSAMDEGVALETPEAPAGAPAPAPEDTPAASQESASTSATESASDDGSQPVDNKPDKETDTEEESETAPDEETEKEIADLGLKDRTAARFRELATSAKAYGPVRDAMAEAGIESADDIKVLAQRSKDFEDLVSMVQDTGATPEQYGQALDMVKMINGAIQGDRQAAESAYQFLSNEVAALAKMLGKEGAGFDPLAEHADLQREVDNGDLSRERALEIVQQRNALTMSTQHQQHVQQQSAQQQAYQQGVQALNDLGDQLEANDPQYRQKVQYLLPTLELIKQQLPPDQWVAATQRAYAQIPAIPEAPKPKPRAPVGPVRSGAMAPALAPTTDDPMEAMELGIQAAG